MNKYVKKLFRETINCEVQGIVLNRLVYDSCIIFFHLGAAYCYKL